MKRGYPDWLKAFAFADQYAGIWSAAFWKVKVGEGKSISLFDSIPAQDSSITDLYTVPEGRIALITDVAVSCMAQSQFFIDIVPPEGGIREEIAAWFLQRMSTQVLPLTAPSVAYAGDVIKAVIFNQEPFADDVTVMLHLIEAPGSIPTVTPPRTALDLVRQGLFTHLVIRSDRKGTADIAVTSVERKVYRAKVRHDKRTGRLAAVENPPLRDEEVEGIVRWCRRMGYRVR